MSNCQRYQRQHDPHTFTTNGSVEAAYPPRYRCDGQPYPPRPQPEPEEVDSEPIPVVYVMCEECRIIVPLPDSPYVADAVLHDGEVMITLHSAAAMVLTAGGRTVHGVAYPKHTKAQP